MHTPISTHSLTRRLTTKPEKIVSSDRYFNSQPHKEADQCHRSRFFVTIYFNSQPHKEADWKKHSEEETHTHFNSQPHKEADEVTF